MPMMLRDGDPGRLDLNDVEGIRLPATARGSGGTGRDDERRIMVEFVTSGGLCRSCDMKMPGQEQVDADLRQSLHGEARTKNDPLAFDPGWQIERMMSHNDLNL